jgi:hypothetical protein
MLCKNFIKLFFMASFIFQSSIEKVLLNKMTAIFVFVKILQIKLTYSGNEKRRSIAREE